METIDFSRIIPEQKREVAKKQKEDKAKDSVRRKKASMVKVALQILLIGFVFGAVYWLSDQYQLQNPIDFKLTTKPWYVKRVTYAPVAYTDDALLVNSSKVDTRLTETVKKSPNPEIAMLILGVFGFDELGEEFVAIFRAESGLNPKAMNWNCEYQENGKLISRACNESDRSKAWSVDCGVAQLNFAGTTCPDQAFDPVWNVKMAKLKYERQGKTAWVASWNDNYKKFLVRNDK